jgi:hypothetical protein
VELGVLDLDVVTKPQEAKQVAAGKVALIAGHPLLIKFRIEAGVGRVELIPSFPVEVVRTAQVNYSARVHDLHGVAIDGAIVNWSLPGDVGTLTAAQTVTDAAGETWTRVLATEFGTGTITAGFGGASATATFTVVDGAPTIAFSSAEVTRYSDRESLAGNVITDAMRATFGTDFAVMNTGGIRADLTCPVIDLPADECPPFTPPPYPITRWQVFRTLPFGNYVVTLTLNGAELHAMLDAALDFRPLQVSGLCYAYDPSLLPGARILETKRQATDGSCSGPDLDRAISTNYSLASIDFLVHGGEGLPVFMERSSVAGLLDQVVAAWIGTNSPLSPTLQGRVTCTSSGAVPCP